MTTDDTSSSVDQIDKKKRLPYGTPRIAFRAHWPKIKEMLEAGWTISTVYKHFQDSLPGTSYRLFIYYVRKYLPLSPWPKQLQQEIASATQSFAPSTSTSVLQQTQQEGLNNDAKPNTFRTPPKFRPAPEIPDPDKIY